MRVARSFMLLILCGLTLSPHVSVADELAPGVLYEGPVELTAPAYGAVFFLPEQWKGILPPESQFFMMERAGLAATVFAGIEEMTLEEAHGLMSQAIDLDVGIRLVPVAEVSTKGQLLVADYKIEGAADPLLGRVVTLVGEHGLGITLLAAATEEAMPTIQKDLHTMIDGVELSKPDVPKQPKPGSGNWMSELNGCKLSRFYTTSGYTEEEYIWLCPDGFYRSFNSGGFGGGASGAFQSKNGGTWTVSGPGTQGSLVLSYNDGSTATYGVALEGTKLFLDGKRWFREFGMCN